MGQRKEEVGQCQGISFSTCTYGAAAEEGIQRFASVILFSQPGSIQLSNPEQNLPNWFLEGFKRYTSMSIA